MRGARRLVSASALLVGLGVAGFVLAQNKTVPPPAPVLPTPPAANAPAPPPTVTTTVPNTPAAKALADAVTPEEGAIPPKAETAKPVIKAEAPAPAPKAPVEPLKRARYTSAVLQAVDKITAETLRFETKVGEPVRYKGLILTVRSCETTAADETAPDSIAFLDVQSQPLNSPGHAAAPPRQVFRGWMFASSPALHPFEHPIYDVWLVACRTAAPVVVAPAAVKTPAVPPKASAKRS
jgi:hypothetical protein